MKRYVFERFSVLLITFLSITSCGDYLDLKPNASLVVPSTLEDLQAILDDSGKMNLRMTPSLGTSVADEYYLLKSTYTGTNVLLQSLYHWQDYEYRNTNNDWARGYEVVYNTNLVFDLLENIDRTHINSAAYDNVKGSAHFYRGFYFLGLVTQYGHAFDEDTSDQDLGIVLRLASDFNIPSKRASVRESYEQIIEDLTKASELLPDYAEHVMRPSRAAAHAALARTYLYMRKYDLALEHTEKALALYDRLMDFNDDEDVLGITAAIPFRKFNKETIFYAEAATSPLYVAVRAVVDTLLYDSYSEYDLRKYAFFNIIEGNAFYKGSYASHRAIEFGGISTNELYLMKAECMAFLNEIGDAMSVLNELLKARWIKAVDYMPAIASDREGALAIIREERKKELCFRNLRWADIKRYNKEGANITLRRNLDGRIYELLPNASFYALPLPADIVELTGMPQN